MMKEKR